MFKILVCPFQSFSLKSKSSKIFNKPGNVSNGVASTTEEHERQVVLLHEFDALGVTWRK